MANEPLITNERAQREWLYLIDRVGESVARNAIEKLPGSQRAYPINIAKALSIKLPSVDKLPLTADKKATRDSATEQGIAELKELIKHW